MPERKIILTKEECTCGLADFYKSVAIKAGYSPSEKRSRYDCRKISVPAEVFSSIKAYYMHHGDTCMGVVAMWAMCGPKAACDSDSEHPYYVVIQDGFYTEEGEN